MAAYQIADYAGHYEAKCPPEALFTKIHGDKNQQEQVKWDPDFRFSQKREHTIKKRIYPLLVNQAKKPVIEFQQVIEENRNDINDKENHY